MPMIWNQQENYDTDWYVFLTKLTGFSSKTRHKIKYANVKIVYTRVWYTTNMLPPDFPTISTSTISTVSKSNKGDTDF